MGEYAQKGLYKARPQIVESNFCEKAMTLSLFVFLFVSI